MQVDDIVPEIPVALKLEHMQHTGSFKVRELSTACWRLMFQKLVL